MAASLFRPQCAQIIRMHMFAPANTWTKYLCLKRNYYSGHPYDCITWPAMTALLPDAYQQSTDVTGRWMGPKTGSTRNGSDVNGDPKHKEHSKYNSKKPKRSKWVSKWGNHNVILFKVIFLFHLNIVCYIAFSVVKTSTIFQAQPHVIRKRFASAQLAFHTSTLQSKYTYPRRQNWKTWGGKRVLSVDQTVCSLHRGSEVGEFQSHLGGDIFSLKVYLSSFDINGRGRCKTKTPVRRQATARTYADFLSIRDTETFLNDILLKSKHFYWRKGYWMHGLQNIVDYVQAF